MSNMDNLALFSSEIFREYAKLENIKEAQNLEKEQNDRENSIKLFNDLQNRINASPELKKSFKEIQAKLLEDEDCRAKTDPKFVEGVLLLSFED